MVTKMQIRDRSVVIYRQADVTFYSEKRRSNMLTVRKSRYSGKMTGGTRKRITKAITLMAMATPKKWKTNPMTGREYLHHLSFCTLTVSDTTLIDHSRAYAELLAPFLQWLRDTKGVKAYVWKAELQKRLQIHYHIVFPDFIHHREIRKKWNHLQHKAGILTNFAKEYGHFMPPSTEIKAKQSTDCKYMVKNIIEEMAKTIDALELDIKTEIDKEIASGQLNLGTGSDFEYWYKKELTERVQRQVQINGKTWDCSLNLSHAVYYTVDLYAYHWNALEQIENTLIIKEGDWHLIITFKDTGPPEILSKKEREGLNIHLKSIINN
jgi:hypothetical protein